MDSRQDSSTKSPTPLWKLLIAGLWIVGFLWYFFEQPISGPDVRRFDLWLMMADAVLGVSESPKPGQDGVPPSGLQYLPQRLPIFGWALAIVVIAGTHGLAAVQCLRPPLPLLHSERIVLCFGTGLSLLSLITLCCGLAGQLNLIAIASPSLVSIAIIFYQARKSPCQQSEMILMERSRRRSQPLAWLTLIVIVPFIGYLLLGAMTPPFDFDVREYHLQGPKEWFEQGRISFLRHNVYTSFPFLSEMLSLTGMTLTGDWWKGALVGQVVLSCFQLLSSLAVFAIGKRWINDSVAWLATLIYLTTPWTLRISLIAYAEGALTFFLIASTMTALWFRVCNRGQGPLAILCGFLAGSAMASKYTGLISVILPTAIVMTAGLVSHRRKDHPSGQTQPESTVDFRYTVLLVTCYVLGIVFAVSPWLMRNLHDTGNPVYPLGYSVFGGDEWSGELNARWKPAHAPAEHRLSEIPRHFLDAAVRNPWTSALLFALSVPSLLLWRRNRTVPILCCLIAWGFFTWWALTHRIDRFWIPVIPLLSLAAASSWLLSESRLWRSFIGTVIAVVTVFNIHFCELPALMGFHAGLMDLDAAHDVTIRADIQMLNESLPDNAKVLMVGDAEVFDATFPLIYNTVFDDCLFEQMTSHPDDAGLPIRQRRLLPAAEIRSVFKTAGITHVLVHWGEILRYRIPGSYDYTDFVQPARFQSLVTGGLLNPPQTLLQRPWSSLPEREQAIVLSWDEAENFITDLDTFAIVQLFSVTDGQLPAPQP
jgi:hypothetical protein